MQSSIINGEGELRGQPANPGLPGKWPLKRNVCVRLRVSSDASSHEALALMLLCWGPFIADGHS